MGVEEDRGLPDPVTLAKMLRYEPETGRLFWLERDPSMFKPGNRGAIAACRTWNTQNVGKEAFLSSKRGGYRYGSIDGRNVYAHRAAWVLMTGVWSVYQIDHLNHNPTDNRWVNLRMATIVENHHNLSMARNNTSGVTGVSWDARLLKWSAYINHSRKHHLGHFVDKDDAIAARRAAELHLNFHPNHGKAAA